jgi:hypothetical protein
MTVMEPTPDREEKMATAAPEATWTTACQLEEEGEDFVLRIPRWMVTREQVQRFLNRLKFQFASREEREPGDVEELLRKSERFTPLTTQERALRAIERLPADATVGEMMDQLHFLARIERGLHQIETGQVVSHEEAKRRFGL